MYVSKTTRHDIRQLAFTSRKEDRCLAHMELSYRSVKRPATTDSNGLDIR